MEATALHDEQSDDS